MKISVNNLSIKYDGHSLFENVSFDVQCGQTVCIDGPSGCGKSSLLRAMLGFVRPQQGTISIGEEPVDDKSVWSLRHKIAYVTQEPDLGQQAVLDRIRQPFEYKANAHLSWNETTVHEWFDRFNLPKKLLSKQTTDLSGGEKQRIAIIIALLLDRPVLLLDEPTSALDKQSKRILKDVLAETQKTIVLISHEDILTDIADATVQLAEGEGGRHA
ncbi:MAG: energy-coupling factor ABC transporter ATP-binding protein [Phycisphaerae bacterium]|nr:energy-coupling factor ABC transporter ATP-binding protein [Phycisphaerae bacterium]